MLLLLKLLNVLAASNILRATSVDCITRYHQENYVAVVLTFPGPTSMASVRCILPSQTPEFLPRTTNKRSNVSPSHFPHTRAISPRHHGHDHSLPIPRPTSPGSPSSCPIVSVSLPVVGSRRVDVRPLSSGLHFSTPSRRDLVLTHTQDFPHEDCHSTVAVSKGR